MKKWNPLQHEREVHYQDRGWKVAWTWLLRLLLANNTLGNGPSRQRANNASHHWHVIVTSRKFDGPTVGDLRRWVIMLVSESFPSVVQIFETGGDNVSEGSQVGNSKACLGDLLEIERHTWVTSKHALLFPTWTYPLERVTGPMKQILQSSHCHPDRTNKPILSMPSIKFNSVVLWLHMFMTEGLLGSWIQYGIIFQFSGSLSSNSSWLFWLSFQCCHTRAAVDVGASRNFLAFTSSSVVWLLKDLMFCMKDDCAGTYSYHNIWSWLSCRFRQIYWTSLSCIHWRT